MFDGYGDSVRRRVDLFRIFQCERLKTRYFYDITLYYFILRNILLYDEKN